MRLMLPAHLTGLAAVFGSATLLLAVAPGVPAQPSPRAAAAGGGAGPTPMPVTNSSQVPADVSIPGGFMGNPIAFFDDYSWRAFIALVWPGLRDQRGQPDTGAGVTVGSPGPRVFETYKALWEVFHNDGTPPAAWNAYEPARYNPCGVAAGWGDLTLGSFSKFSDLGQAGFGNLVGPLVAQPATNPSYVRFMTAYNQIEFGWILNPTGAMPPTPLYLRANLAAMAQPVTAPIGSIDIKAAWIDLTHVPNPERYYRRPAYVLDPATGNTLTLSVGLVGLHIVQKTPSRPQWIWSTFEFVGNVPDAAGAAGPFAFNDGTGKAMPASNPYPLNPLKLPTPAPFNVTRTKPIHDSTKATNTAYQSALKFTVWANYQLVMTQWPTTPNAPNLPGDPANTFPGFPAGVNDKTAFANTTMETFDQGNVRSGCMNCHNLTRTQSDFIWSLQDHAFPPVVPNLLIREATFRNLRDLLHDTRKR